jgi:DNA (cytosine-5)-methyltransferase 1
MRRISSQNTEPELLLRKALRLAGIRFRTCVASLPGKPDIVIPSRRTVIFVDGDFWHGAQWKRRNHLSLEQQFNGSPSKLYWIEKIRKNMHRDCVATSKLLANGWKVLRFWEGDIAHRLNHCVEMSLDTVNDANPPSFSVLPEKTVCEFFAGIGLMRMGLEREGWSVVFANDIDEEKAEMYAAQFPDSEDHLVIEDIHRLNADQIPSATLATASFPCNDLSLAGSRSGLRGKQSSAYWGFITILEKLEKRRPPLVLLENVTGFLTSHGGADFTNAMVALNKLGYAVDAFILDAARFVPQSRQRLFVIGILDDNNLTPRVLEPASFYESDVRPKSLADFIFTHPEIHWNIRPLPNQPARSKSLPDILDNSNSSEWWDGERAAYLLNQMSPRHHKVADGMIAGNQFTYGTVFRRIRNGKSMAELRTDGMAGCLRTPRGGSGRQILFKAGKGKYFARLLSPRECARLMGADDYKIRVPLNQALFGFGDAVCVPVVEWIAKYYLNPVVNELLRNRHLVRPVAQAS